MEMVVNSIEYITVVYMDGRLDIFETEYAESRLFGIAEKNPDNHIIIVLEGLEHLGSSGLRIFISLKRHLDGRGKRLLLCNDTNNAVHNFFRIVNIRQMFDIFWTAEEAIRYLVSNRLAGSGCVA